MEILKSMFEFFQPGIPMVAAIIFGILILFGLRKYLEKKYESQPDRNMRMQLIMLVLSFVLLVIVIIVSPASDSQQGQILSLIGIVLSAAIALSSTTFVGNAMAGLMIRAVKGFKMGDFISVNDNFGRVTERGLFHIEIQTEQRDLITLPNLQLVTSAVKVVRSSGTIVWAEVSLGYDVPRSHVKKALLKAAEKAELKDPFVHIMLMGDFSVLYRISGLLTEVKQLLSTRSRIREMVLDELHESGIEIVSPNFMNTRQLNPQDKIIPEKVRENKEEVIETAPENIVFDKAEEAESIEKLHERRDKLLLEIEELKASDSQSVDENSKIEVSKKIESIEVRISRLNEFIEKRKSEID